MNGNATTIGKNIVIYPESPFLKTSTEDSIGSVRRIFLSRVKSDSNGVDKPTKIIAVSFGVGEISKLMP